MGKSWIEGQIENPEQRRLFEQERLILWATEAIHGAMEDSDVQKADLAEALGTSRSYITQVLSGSRNMTLRTLSDLAWAVGSRAVIALEPLREGEFVSTPVKLSTLPRPTVVTEDSVDETTGGVSNDLAA